MLSASLLKTELRAALLDANAGWLDNADLTATCEAIANAVVAHIVTNATVLPVGLPVPLTAPPGGGPVTGTGTIT